jgi:cyclopropane-fatty-acyl-phospholipid synthase
MSVEQIIRNIINKEGFIAIDKFMEIALYDKNFGYYINKNPIGKDSDFITAPEITSLFGETIALFFVEKIRNNLSNYQKINIIELGAGQGTLALDILNAFNKFTDIYQKIKYIILDCNIKLVEIQKEKLKNHIDKVIWINNLDEIDSPSPVIFLANEFFDCLPIKQFFKQKNEFFERIIVENDRNFAFSSKKAENLPSVIENFAEDYEDDEIIEYSEASINFIQKIAEVIKKNKGIALIIDYGYAGFTFGDSLQSISSHKYNNIFEKIGESDLTVHVNFRLLYYFAMQAGIKNLYINNQSDFLRQLGIELLAQKKLIKLGENQKKDLFLAVNRLLDFKQMGELFKCFLIENF